MTVLSLAKRCGRPSLFFIMDSKERGKIKRFYICEEHSLSFIQSRMPVDHNFVYPCEEEMDWIR